MNEHLMSQGLASLGRGRDSMLMHVTPREVEKLQSLAMAHGGSLTINPHTGLPEAGFLDTILSIGGGIIGGMYGGPWGAALGSGLGKKLGGGSTEEALMAGVMSYGLGGLGESLSTSGGDILSQGVRDTAAQVTDLTAQEAAQQATEKAAQEAAKNTAREAAQNAPTSYTKLLAFPEEQVGRSGSGATTYEDSQPFQSSRAVDIAKSPYFSYPDTPTFENQLSTGVSPEKPFNFDQPKTNFLGEPQAGYTKNLAGTGFMPTPATPDYLDKVKVGFDKATDSWGAAKDFAKNNGKFLGAAALGTLGTMAPKPQPLQKNPIFSGNRREFDYDPITQKYTAKPPVPVYVAQGGLMGLATGGSIPDLSVTTYPQSGITMSKYAPQGQLIDGTGPKIDPFTGAQKLDGGGQISSVQPVSAFYLGAQPPKSGSGTDIDPTKSVVGEDGENQRKKKYVGSQANGMYEPPANPLASLTERQLLALYKKSDNPTIFGSALTMLQARAAGQKEYAKNRKDYTGTDYTDSTITAAGGGLMKSQNAYAYGGGVGKGGISNPPQYQPQQTAPRTTSYQQPTPSYYYNQPVRPQQPMPQLQMSPQQMYFASGPGQGNPYRRPQQQYQLPTASVSNRAYLQNLNQTLRTPTLPPSNPVATPLQTGKGGLLSAPSSGQKATYNPDTQTYTTPVSTTPAPAQNNNGGTDSSNDNGGSNQEAAGGRIRSRRFAMGGGIGDLYSGTYAAGGQLLRGGGDGVSDSIPAVIQGAVPQKAALADGEFVLPARIVSEIGNGSTEAGARRLYAMMDRIQRRRRSAKNIAADTKVERMLPA